MKQVCSNLSSWSCENFWLIWILSWPSFYNPKHLLDYLSFCLFRALLSLQWWPLQMKIENPLNILHVNICCCLGAVPKDSVCLHFHFLGNFKHSSFIKSWLSLNGTMYPGVIFYRNLSSCFPSHPASRHYLRKAEVRCREKYKTSFEFSGKLTCKAFKAIYGVEVGRVGRALIV